MLSVLRSSWSLLLGMFLLMIGNGLQGSLLGVRGNLEGFDPGLLSYVISAYFAGFLIGSRIAPALIRSVGHVRVFAAMGSLISAAFILYPAIPDLIAWGFLRVVVGIGFSCVYVVAESWLNESADNQNRGKALSLYLIVQMGGIVTAQGLLNFGDPAGYGLFVLISVLVSLSFAPILLSASTKPATYDVSVRMTLRELSQVSPLGFFGSFMIGAVFSALFGMASVYGTERAFSLSEIATFISAIYMGGMILQWPIGWLSDRMDRRLLIIIVTGTAAATCLIAIIIEGSTFVLFGAMFILGGMINPLYALLIAHTNDYLEHEDMSAAAAGLVFVGGVGAVGGPVITGQMMELFGPWAFFLYIGTCMGAITFFGLFRTTRRAAVAVEDTSSYAAVTPGMGAVAVEIAQDYAIEQMDDADNVSDNTEIDDELPSNA